MAGGRWSEYLRRNVLGLVALFVALGGTAAALPGRDRVATEDIKRQAVTKSKLGKDAVTGSKVEGDSLKGKHIREQTLDFDTVQRRVGSGCESGEAIRSIREDGGVDCAETTSSAIAGISTTDGLTGGGDGGEVTLGVDNRVLQERVAPGCGAGEAIRSVNADGSVACQAAGAGGTVTSLGVAAGSGLEASPSPITTTGTIDTDFGTIQRRVGGTCAGDRAIQGVDAGGGVDCSGALVAASRVLTPQVSFVSDGASEAVLGAHGLELVNDCTGPAPEVLLRALPGNSGSVVSSVASSNTVALDFLAGGDETTIASAGSTPPWTRGEFNVGLDSGETFSGSFSTIDGGGGCQVVASALAS